MIRAKPPYTDHPGNQTNIKDWLRGQRQRQADRELAREQRLKPMGRPGRPKAKN